MKKKLIINIEAQPESAELSVTKQLEGYLPDIESYMQQGIRRQIILDHLNEEGFNLTMATFETMLKRLRKRVRNGKLRTATQRQLRERPTAADTGGVDLYRDGPKKLKHDLTKTSDW